MSSKSRKYLYWYYILLPIIFIFHFGEKIFCGSSELITNMFVFDSNNAQDWSIRTNLQVGDLQFGDRSYNITTIPGEYAGADWIRTANDSKEYDGDTLVTFQVTDTVDVLVAFDDRLTPRDWLSTWSDTGKKIINSETLPKTFSLYIKSFKPYDFVNLGSINQVSGSNNYTVICNRPQIPGQVPNPFAFNDLFDVPLSSESISESINVSGITVPTQISINHGAYSINNGPFQTNSSMVNDGDQVRIRLKSSATYGKVTTTKLSIGQVSADFSVRTLDEPQSGWVKVPDMLGQIESPVFPDSNFLVTDFGALPDGVTLCTAAFKQAIEACSNAGGGRVVVPIGQYLTGAIHLKNNVNLYISQGAIIKFSQDPADFLPVVYTRFEGTECYNYSPCIYAFEQENIAITGTGTLNGQGDNEHWWNWKSTGDTDVSTLRQQAEDGVPVDERIYGDGHYLRPNMIQPYRCQNVFIDSVTILNGPMWHIHPVLCNNVIVSNVSVIGHGPNNDGCNPESCRDVWIYNCFFDTGDDCIAIKSGRNADGRRVNVPTENVVIQNCNMKDGHGGVVIGSEISGGGRNIFAEDCMMDSPNLNRALRIKTNSMRGGIIENIYLRNIIVGEVTDAVFRINYFYGEGDIGSFLPIVRNVEIRNLICEKSTYALRLEGYARSPITDIRLINCRIDNISRDNILSNIQNLVLNRVNIEDVEYQKIMFPVQEDPTDMQKTGQLIFPETIQLLQNYPNPFNPSTIIMFTVPQLSPVKLEVYDLSGKKITTLVNESKKAGQYMVYFNGSHLGSGMYIYKLVVAGQSEVRKMVLLK
jgi:polygalacturonase